MNDSIVQCGRPTVVGEIVGTGYSLMAVRLPAGFEDKSAFWTHSRWALTPHQDLPDEIRKGLPREEIVG